MSNFEGKRGRTNDNLTEAIADLLKMHSSSNILDF